MVTALLIGAVWLLPQVAQVVLPRPQALASAQHDEIELERLAQRLGPARLLQIAAGITPGSARGPRVAALRGLGLVGRHDAGVAAQALLPLTDLLAQISDPHVLEAGAEAARRLAESLQGASAPPPNEGDDGGELRRAAQALLKLAADQALRPEVRGVLIEAAAGLPGAVVQSVELLELARTGPPPVRRAALQGLGRLSLAGGTGEQGQRDPLQPLVLQFGDDELSAAAALALCDFWPRTRTPPATGPDPAVLERMRALAEAGKTSPLPAGMVRALAGCLRQFSGGDRAPPGKRRGRR